MKQKNLALKLQCPFVTNHKNTRNKLKLHFVRRIVCSGTDAAEQPRLTPALSNAIGQLGAPMYWANLKPVRLVLHRKDTSTLTPPFVAARQHCTQSARGSSAFAPARPPASSSRRL